MPKMCGQREKLSMFKLK
uniref:Uncharacterized protein n=1 Tax=Anguilla anguilla TaxID=7936 RepID=A0A0E9TAH2_ANGAN